MKSVTLQQVADAAGVHAATASRALNPATRKIVKSATVERVLKAADELGYVVNPMARGLRTNKSMTVGVLIPDVTNPFYPPIIRGIDDELNAYDYVPLVANTDNNPAREKTLYERLRGRQVDGFIMATARVDHPLIASAARDGVKMVLVSRTVDGVDLPAVVIDDAAVMRLAVEHLRGLGHTRIGHVTGPQDVSTGRNRKIGFIEVCRDLGLDHAAIVDGDAFTIEEGQRCAARLLDAFPVTAIVAGNDLMALGCLAEVQRRGLSCPADISVVGSNDMSLLDRIDPPLTSVSTPKHEMGRAAAEILIEAMAATGPVEPTLRKLDPVLIVRASTAPPPSS